MNLMIGFSTEQNTVNLISAIQLKASKFVLLETSLATKKEWSKWVSAVTKKKPLTQGKEAKDLDHRMWKIDDPVI